MDRFKDWCHMFDEFWVDVLFENRKKWLEVDLMSVNMLELFKVFI